MNKAELVAALAKETGFTKKDAEKALKGMTAVIKAELKKKEGKVQLAEVGTIKAVKRAARKVRNPRTGETMTSPACKVAKFVAAKALKDAINKK
ncbi:MAG: HU family DNA-binding protein [Eubacteriales bacterium]|nr:HU family DNA-binding protein [Lachnospiraceae bacterium]MDO4809431.1 HU family DNA-binding protein [Eubacteriales bacterium]